MAAKELYNQYSNLYSKPVLMAYILNGELIQQTHTNLPIDKNGSFWYGDGFFEAMKYVNGKLLFAELHWERIVTSCQILKMKNPFKNAEYFKEMIALLLKEDGNPIQRIKLTLWRNTFIGYQPEGDKVEYLVTSDPLSDSSYVLNNNGLGLGIYSENLKSISKLGNVKSTSSQLYVLATLYAQSKNLDDVILLNTRGNILETSRSNIGVVINGTIYTPPLNEGCLDGIMRRVLLQICNEENIPIQQEPISLDMLKKADEVFTTSAIRGIQWVKSIGEQVFDTQKISIQLSKLLNSRVQ